MTAQEKFSILEKLYLQTLKKHKLPHLPFKRCNSKKAIGMFKSYRGYKAEGVYISSYWLQTAPIEILNDVVLHEIAHYMDFLKRGKSDHGLSWQRCCLIVGADPSRTKDIPDEFAPQDKYEAHCPTHGKVGGFNRMGRKWQMGRYVCAKCKEKLYVIEK